MIREKLKSAHTMSSINPQAVTIEWNTTTVDLVKGSEGLFVLQVNSQLLTIVNEYSAKRSMPMTGFKTTSELIYRIMVAYNNYLGDLAHQTQTKVSDFFSFNAVDTGIYYNDVMEMYNANISRG